MSKPLYTEEELLAALQSWSLYKVDVMCGNLHKEDEHLLDDILSYDVWFHTIYKPETFK